MTLPVCRRCKAVSVLDPCRRCATPAELAKYPLAPWEREIEEATAWSSCPCTERKEAG